MISIKMLSRKFKSLAVLLLRDYVLGFPRVVVEWTVSWLFRPETTRGVQVVDWLAETRGEFLRAVGDALSLLAKSDERRFKRVQREIRTIAHTPSGLSVAKYFRPLRICDVDLRYFFDRDPANTARLLAAALVHEATHGALYSAGVIQTKRNHSRVERLCNTEAGRFLLRVGLRESPFSSHESAAAIPTPLGMRLRQLIKDTRELFSRDLQGEADTWRYTRLENSDAQKVAQEESAERVPPPSEL